MSQYPGGQQPPYDPYYGQPPADPYAPPPPPSQDPYYGQPPGDPYAPPPDPYYSGQAPDAGQYGQQGYYQQQPGWGPPPAPRPMRRNRGGSGAAIFGILLVLVGVWVLFGDRLDLDLDWSEIWPLGAVAIGALMVLASLIPGRAEGEG